MSYYIYKICCDDLPDYIYIGSTKAFRERKRRHKRESLSNNSKLYTTIRENGGWGNWLMVILEDCGEINFIQAKIKEEEYRMKLNGNLNSQRCYRTEEQIKEQIKETKSNWYLNAPNPKFDCECGGKYTLHHKEAHFKTKKHCEYIFNLK
tara:strand:+ start:79 stop:528 length:450 start_codon:yes stop_codon:yes gene_type:complete